MEVEIDAEKNAQVLFARNSIAMLVSRVLVIFWRTRRKQDTAQQIRLLSGKCCLHSGVDVRAYFARMSGFLCDL